MYFLIPSISFVYDVDEHVASLEWMALALMCIRHTLCVPTSIRGLDNKFKRTASPNHKKFT